MNNRTRLAATTIAGAIAFFSVSTALAAPVTLNFDDIAPLDNPTLDTFVPADYGGFVWTTPSEAATPFSLHNDIYMGDNSVDPSLYGNSYGAPSGKYAVMANYNFSISRSEDFQVSSIFATSLAANNVQSTGSASTLIFTGFKDGVQTGRLEFNLSVDRYDEFMLSSLGVIDRLAFEATGTQTVGHWYLFDNLTFDTAVAPAPVPVPAAVWLLGSGVGMLFAGRRRKAA